MKIHVMKVYKESFHDIRIHLLEWTRVASGPILLFFIGMIIFSLAGGMSGPIIDAEEIVLSPALLLSSTLYFIFTFVASLSFIVNGSRYAVLKEGGDRWFTFNFNIRLAKLVFYGILVVLLLSLYSAIAAGILLGVHFLFKNIGLDAIVGFFLGIYALYLLFRISLYQIAISVDHSEPIKTSLRLMKGNVLRFIGLIILVSLTVWLIAGIVGLVLALITALLALGGSLILASLLLWIPFSAVMLLVSWAVNVKATGLVYKELLGRKK